LLFIHGHAPPCWTGLLQDRPIRFGRIHGLQGLTLDAAKDFL